MEEQKKGEIEREGERERERMELVGVKTALSAGYERRHN
jgi:hypothetical protein